MKVKFSLKTWLKNLFTNESEQLEDGDVVMAELYGQELPKKKSTINFTEELVKSIDNLPHTEVKYDEGLEPATMWVPELEDVNSVEQAADILFEKNDAQIPHVTTTADYSDVEGMPFIQRINGRLNTLRKKRNNLADYLVNCTAAIDTSTSKKFTNDVGALKMLVGGEMMEIEGLLSVPYEELESAGLDLATLRELKDTRKALTQMINKLNAQLKANPEAYEVVKKLKGNMGISKRAIGDRFNEVLKDYIKDDTL